MSNPNNINLADLYKSMLTVTRLKAGEDGTMYYDLGGDDVPLSVEGKGVTLPTTEGVRHAFSKNQHIFHILNENAAGKVNPLFTKYMQAVTTELNATIGSYLINLSNLAATPEHQKTLPPSAIELLQTLGEIDEIFAQKITLIAAKVSASSDINDAWIKLFIKRNGKIKGVIHKQACIVSFPIFDAIEKGDPICGIKLRKKDIEPIKRLYATVLSKVAQQEVYNKGSSSSIAPSTDALMQSVYEVYTDLTNFTSLLPETIADLEFIPAVVDNLWVDAFKDIDKYRISIIALPATAVAETPPAPIAQPVGTPVGVNFAQLQHNPHTPPMMQQMQPVAQPGTFAAILNQNPQLAMAANNGVFANAIGGAPSMMPRYNNTPMMNRFAPPTVPTMGGSTYSFGVGSNGF